jgi:hypothetical protein
VFPFGHRHTPAVPGWRAIFTLALGLTLAADSVSAGDAPPEKRVENRGKEIQTTPSLAKPTPERPRETPPASKPPDHADKDKDKDKDQRPCPEPTPATEETKTEVRQEVVVLEVTRPAEESPDYLTLPEVLQDTLGRPRVDSVIACTDPRYPLPGYAWVGLAPDFSLKAPGDTVRLQRLDCELEVGSEWQPGDSVFTLVAGSSVFQITPSDEEHPELHVATEARSGRKFAVSVGISKTGSLAQTARYVLSLKFVKAASGRAPLLRPGDAVYLQIGPSPTAPPTYAMPRFLLVPEVPGTPSTLRLIEKSGSITGGVPAIRQLELAAFLSVVHRIPQ